MTLQELATQLQGEITAGNELSLTADSIDNAGWKALFPLMNMDALVFTGIQTSDITVNTGGDELTIASAANIYTLSSETSTLVLSGSTDVADAAVAFNGEVTGVEMSDLETWGLISSDTVDPGTLPDYAFPSVAVQGTADASGSSASWLLQQEYSDEPFGDIPGLKDLGVSLEKIGFQIELEASMTTTTSLVIYGDYDITGDGESDLRVSLDLPVGPFGVPNQWKLTFSGASEDHGVPLTDLIQLMAGANIYTMIPTSLTNQLSKFGINSLQIIFNAESGSVTSIYLDLGSVNPEDEWDIATDLTLKSVGFTASVENPFNSMRSLTAMVYGLFRLGDDEKNILEASMTYASSSGDWTLAFSADLEFDNVNVFDSLPGGSLISTLDLPTDVSSAKVNLENLSITFNPSSGQLGEVALNVETDFTWQLISDNSGGNVLSVADPYIDLTISNPLNSTTREIVGSIGGQLIIGTLGMSLVAEQQSSEEGWVITASTLEGNSISIKSLANTLMSPFGITVDDDIVPGDLGVTNIAFSYWVKTGSMTFKAETDGYWVFTFDPLPELQLAASVDLAYAKETVDGKTEGKLSGSIFGEVVIPDINLDVKTGYDFEGDNTEIWVEWETIRGTFNTSKKTMTLAIGDRSFGDILLALVKLVNPGQRSYSLPEPFDLFNSISLKGFSMVLYFGDEADGKQVDIKYTPDPAISLFFIDITEFTFTKKKVTSSEDQSIFLSLTGSFLGQPIDTGSVLNDWDVINNKDGAPQVPGQGTQLLDLQYMGLGQRVALQSGNVEDMEDALNKLREAFTNPSSGNVPVPSDGSGESLIYSANSNWLVATEFTLLQTFRLGIIFNDPDLYGLLIDINGPKAGVFQGLKFQILYKKITDDIGVYQAELKLPDAIRQLEFGAVSITLPVIGVAIYTNGNFSIDLGYPWNRDFTRSFTIQAFPFIGSGGVYFAKLNGETAKNLPETTCGVWGDVYEFGLGLRLGLGKEINKGILSAGFSVSAEGIFFGTIGFYNPNSGNPGEGEKYYKVEATLALVGKLYGTVDFAIVSASVNLTVYAMISTVIEAYKDIPIQLEAGVSVSVSVKIKLGFFKITLHFSFSTTIKENFTIKVGDTNAPWYACNGAVAARRLAAKQALSAPNWRALTTDTATTLNLWYSPHLSAYYDSSAAAQRALFVHSLFIEGGAADAPNASFDELAIGVFNWVLSTYLTGNVAGDTVAASVLDDTTVTRDQLQAIFDDISEKNEPISYTDITTFLGTYFTLEVSAIDPATEQTVSASLFPMPPVMDIKDSEGTERNLGTWTSANEDYHQDITDFFQQMAAQYMTAAEKSEAPTKTYAADDSTASVAQYVFQDYFVLLARFSLQSAMDLMDKYSLPTTADLNSLDEIVTWAQSQGTDISASALATANADLAVAADSVTVSGAVYQLSAGGTLYNVADAFVGNGTGLDDADFPGKIGALSQNDANIILAGVTLQLEVDGETRVLVTSVGDRLSTMAEYFGYTDVQTFCNLDEVKNSPFLNGPYALPIPDFSTAAGGGSLTDIATKYGLVAGDLGDPNAGLADIFGQGVDVTVPDLQSLTVTVLSDDLKSSGDLATLSGMSGRYMLNGLRLPITSNVTFNDSAPCAENSLCPMYNVIGQQIPLPDMSSAESYSVTLSKPEEVTWITFSGGTEDDSLTVTLDKDQLAEVVSVQSTALSPQIDELRALTPGSVTAETFRLRTYYPWAMGAPVTLPHNDGGGDDTQPLRLWSLPQQLQRAINQDKALQPKFTLVSRPADAPTADPTAWPNYGWGLMLAVSIRKVTDSGSGILQPFSYEIAGADAAGIGLLEKLVSYYGEHADDPVERISILYPPNSSEGITAGLQGAGDGNFTGFITQTNLSTETNPPEGGMLRAVKETSSDILNTNKEFSQFLWEASIVRSGGFFLTYYDSVSKTGLPETLFDDQGMADIYVLFRLSDTTDVLQPYTNMVLTSGSVDESTTLLYAMAGSQDTSFAYKGTSLESVAAQFYISAIDLAEQWAGITLNTAITLNIPASYYEVGPDDTLSSIASKFHKTEQEIKDANPGVDFDNLSVFTLLTIPATPGYTPGDWAGGTLSTIQSSFNLDANVLYYAVQGVSNIFPGSTDSPVNMNLTDIADLRSASLPAGHVGFEMLRKDPGEVNTDGTLDVSVLLENNYNLLALWLGANADFSLSPEGLPAGPGDQDQGSEENLAADESQWHYQHVIPAYKYSTHKASDQTSGPPASDNPYQGAGTMAQIALAWRDLFGNEVQTPFSDPPSGYTGPLNYLPAMLGYTDALTGLGSWPSVQVDYRFLDGKLQVDLAFNSTPYEDEGGADLALADLGVWTRICYQLAQDDVTAFLSTSFDGETEHSIDKSTLLTWANTIYDWINKVSQGEDPGDAPAGITPSVTPGDAVSGGIFELTAQCTLRRDASLVHPFFYDQTDVYESVSNLKPFRSTMQVPGAAGDDENNPLTLVEFAQDLESQYSGLKVATATDRDALGQQTDNEKLYIVRFGENGITYDIDTSSPVFFGLPPISNSLVSRSQTELFPWSDANGLETNSSYTQDLTGIDMDTWGRSILSAIDSLMTPGFAAAAFIVDDKNGGSFDADQECDQIEYDSPSDIDQPFHALLKAKECLAEAISTRIKPILKNTSGDTDGAAEKLKQSMLNKLSSAYTVNAVTQYPVTASYTPAEGERAEQPPRLYAGVQGDLLDENGNAETETQRDYTLSSGKIQLNDTTTLNFLVSTRYVEQQSYLHLSLSYPLSYIEFDIHSVPGMGEYEGSSWLSFVIPVSAEDLGETRIPIPLRAFPTPPSLVSQTGDASVPPDNNNEISLEDAVKWTYVYSFLAQHAAQDSVRSEVSFNLQESGMALRAEGGYDLFDALAQFSAVWSDISVSITNSLALIGLDTDPQSADFQAALRALQAMAWLSIRASKVWAGWVSDNDVYSAQASMPAEENYTYDFIQEVGDDDEYYQNVKTIEAGGSIPAPQINLPDYSTEAVTGKEDTYRYYTGEGNDKQYLSYNGGRDIAERDVAFDDLNILLKQNASAGVSQRRNEYLIPTDPTVETADAFIYSTAMVRFSNPLYPMIDCDATIDIAKLNTNPEQSLAEHLSKLFSTLFDGLDGSQEIKLSIQYQFKLNQGKSQRFVSLPVLMLTPFDFQIPDDYGTDCDAGSSLVCKLTQALDDWYTRMAPSTVQAQFRIDLSVYTQSSTQLPTLRLRDLILAIADINSSPFTLS